MFACLRVFFAQDAKGNRLEPILRLGRRSSPSVPGSCGVWRVWGRSGSTLSEANLQPAGGSKTHQTVTSTVLCTNPGGR